MVETYQYSTERGARVRFHKFVHFYLLRYTGGTTDDHDHEVNEARWFEVGEAAARLAFANERRVARRAAEMIGEGFGGAGGGV